MSAIGEAAQKYDDAVQSYHVAVENESRASEEVAAAESALAIASNERAAVGANALDAYRALVEEARSAGVDAGFIVNGASS